MLTWSQHQIVLSAVLLSEQSLNLMHANLSTRVPRVRPSGEKDIRSRMNRGTQEQEPEPAERQAPHSKHGPYPSLSSSETNDFLETSQATEGPWKTRWLKAQMYSPLPALCHLRPLFSPQLRGGALLAVLH